MSRSGLTFYFGALSAAGDTFEVVPVRGEMKDRETCGAFLSPSVHAISKDEECFSIRVVGSVCRESHFSLEFLDPLLFLRLSTLEAPARLTR